MKVEIHNVFKNARYKFFQTEDGTYYIVEIKPSFRKMLFPFLYWFSSFPVYKVEDKETIERIQTPESRSFNKITAVLAMGGVAKLMTTFTREKEEMLTFDLSLYMKFFLFFLTIFLVLVIRLYVNKAKFNDLSKHVDLKQLERLKIKAKPQSFKHIAQMFGIYIFFLSFSALSYGMFFLDGNIFILVTGAVMLLMLSILVNLTLKEGLTKVKFIKCSPR